MSKAFESKHFEAKRFGPEPPPTPEGPTITADTAAFPAGARITWSGATTVTDWLDMAPAGSPDGTTGSQWRYTSGTQVAPPDVIPSGSTDIALNTGSYEARFRAADGLTIIARSAVFEVP